MAPYRREIHVTPAGANYLVVEHVFHAKADTAEAAAEIAERMRAECPELVGIYPSWLVKNKKGA